MGLLGGICDQIACPGKRMCDSRPRLLANMSRRQNLEWRFLNPLLKGDLRVIPGTLSKSPLPTFFERGYFLLHYGKFMILLRFMEFK